ncbi:hypothetical protein [Brevibacterium sp.]|uniref:hypothetical protein n=1 Tax=Brevibacterium sp. TaxID=1701 RepID=UPI0025BC5FE7|nr:hypothetical protein [Brevibacterium sp.]
MRASLPRTGRGRGWFSKRWIYWKRRYSDPTRRDWVMLAVLLAILLALALSPVSFRLTGGVLAAVPAGMGVLRLLGDEWAATVRNRDRGFDATLLFAVAVLLALLTVTVPG